MTCARLIGFVLGLALFGVAVGFWLGWQASGFIAQDRCLDRGGAWNGDARTCLRGEPD